MNEIRLRHAFFRVDPMKNIVGQGDKMAYYIVVTKGATVGTSGPVPVPAHTAAGNESNYEATRGRATNGNRGSWLGRLFAILKS